MTNVQINNDRNHYIRPLQKVTLKEKLRDNGKWWKDTAGSYLNSSIDFSGSTISEIDSLLKAADGELDQSLYSHVLNPLGLKEGGKAKTYPSKLKHFDIIGEVIDTLLGDKIDYPDIHMVVATNPDSNSILDRNFSEVANDMLIQDYINNLNAMGIDTQVANQEVENYSKTKDSFFQNGIQKISATSQKVLDYILYNQEINEKHRLNFKNWLATDRAFSYKTIINDDVHYEIVPPDEIMYIKSDNSIFLEDAHCVVRLQRMTTNELIDRHKEELEKIKTKDFDPFNWLESNYDNSNRNNMVVMTSESFRSTDINSNLYFNDDKHNLYHIVWRAYKPVTVLTFIDLQGEIDEISFEEDQEAAIEAYKDAFEVINEEIIWIDEIWESYSVDDRLWFGGNPTIGQRGEANERSLGKLPYNGLIMPNRNKNINSKVAQGIPYNVIYNIVHYQFEKTINKNKDKIVLVPKGIIPTDEGWDEDTFIYAADALSYMFVDETAPGAAAALQQVRVLDMSLSAYIKQIYDILMAIKQEWKERSGVNDQRQGNISNRAGKAVTEYALSRSNATTRKYFDLYDWFERREDQGFIDLAKIAYVNGKKGNYITSDGDFASLELMGVALEEFLSSEIGIFVRDGQREYEKIQSMKEFAFSFAQNDRDPELIGNIIDAHNMSKLKGYLAKATTAQKELEEQIRNQEMETRKYEADTKAQEAKYKEDMAYQKAVDVALINAGMKYTDDRKEQPNGELDGRKLDLEEKKLENQERQSQREALNKSLDRISAERIAKQNKNKYDK